MRSPVVFTWPRSMPRSRARWRTAGEVRTLALSRGALGDFALPASARGAGARGVAGSFFDSRGRDALLPAPRRLDRAVGKRHFLLRLRRPLRRRLRRPFRSPRAPSRSGSGRRLRPRAATTLPATGDSISTVALSVIMSAICWSSSMRSPTLTCQATISASAMPSPMSGSLNSYFAISRPSLSQAPSSCASDQGNRPIRRRAGRACPSPSRARPALRDDRSSAPERAR